MPNKRGARLLSWGKGLSFAAAVAIAAMAASLPSRSSIAQSPTCPNSNNVFCGYWHEYRLVNVCVRRDEVGFCIEYTKEYQWIDVPVTYGTADPGGGDDPIDPEE
jgi:hypothetical protein